MTNMKKCNYVIALIAAILGGVILYFSAQLGIGFKQKGGTESGTWPAIMGGVLLVAAVILLVMTLVKRKKYEEMEVALHFPANMRVYIMMGIFAVYCVLLRLLGLYLSAVLLIPSIMYVLGEKNKKKIALVTIGTIAAVFIIFQLVLGTKLPEPIWA